MIPDQSTRRGDPRSPVDFAQAKSIAVRRKYGYFPSGNPKIKDFRRTSNAHPYIRKRKYGFQRSETPTFRWAFELVKKVPVGAITDRPWILPKQNPSPQGEKTVICLQEIRKSKIFGGRAMLAPTSAKGNMVSRQSETPTYRWAFAAVSEGRAPGIAFAFLWRLWYS